MCEVPYVPGSVGGLGHEQKPNSACLKGPSRLMGKGPTSVQMSDMLSQETPCGYRASYSV